jgi:hypothetical protein
MLLPSSTDKVSTMPANARSGRSRWCRARHWAQISFLDEDARETAAGNTPREIEDALGVADHAADTASQRDALDRFYNSLAQRAMRRGRKPVPSGHGGVGRQRGSVARPFRRPPPEPGMRLSPHPALQYSVSLFASARRSPRMDGGMASVLRSDCSGSSRPYNGGRSPLQASNRRTCSWYPASV